MRIAIMLFTCVLLLASCEWVSSKFGAKPDIKFLQSGEHYSMKPDLAEVEFRHPLQPNDLAKIDERYLQSLNQEQIDQIYARLTAGPIPDGAFDGGLFFPVGTSGDKRIAEIVGGWKGVLVGLKTEKLEFVGANLWKGKVFFRDERILRNRIDNVARLTPFVDRETSERCKASGKDECLLFPARLYCGQSLLDSRRESIIIDYAFSDEIDGYSEKPDFLAGRKGLKIRDEIRMVRPGFYLGRAYADRAFLLNFTLRNDEIAKRDGDAFIKTGKAAQDCWTGAQVTAMR
jgi:hypothetical protein